MLNRLLEKHQEINIFFYFITLKNIFYGLGNVWYPFFESEVGSDEGQRYRDSEPHGQQCEEGGKRNSTTATFTPQKEVHDEKHGEDDAEKSI